MGWDQWADQCFALARENGIPKQKYIRRRKFSTSFRQSRPQKFLRKLSPSAMLHSQIKTHNKRIITGSAIFGCINLCAGRCVGYAVIFHMPFSLPARDNIRTVALLAFYCQRSFLYNARSQKPLFKARNRHIEPPIQHDLLTKNSSRSIMCHR